MGSAPGKAKVRLKRELRAARRLLGSTRQVQLNSRGSGVLREAAAKLENAITTAEKAARRHRQPVESAVRQNSSHGELKPDQQQQVPRVQKTKPPGAPDPGQDLRQRLLRVAQAGGTTHWPLLAKAKTTSEEARQQLLAQIEDQSGDAPLLSALVMTPGGGPVPCFREILRSVGLAVPRSDEALLRIWRREQERAHATYADSPRPVPPRLVPKASAIDTPHGQA